MMTEGEMLRGGDDDLPRHVGGRSRGTGLAPHCQKLARDKVESK